MNAHAQSGPEADPGTGPAAPARGPFRFGRLLLALVCVGIAAADQADPACTRLAGGLCVMPRIARAAQVAAVLKAGAWQVHALADAGQVAALRMELLKDGSLGRTAWVDARAAEIPWIEDSADLLLLPEATADDLKTLPASLAARILAPGTGEARIGGLPAAQLQSWAAGAEGCDATVDGGVLTLRRRPLAGADAWSHWHHDAGNNPVSTDTLAGTPESLQWLGLPRRGASYRTVMAAQGVLLTLAGGSHVFLPADAANACTLTACALGSGVPLWQRTHRFVTAIQPVCAIGRDAAFLADGPAVIELDLRSGKERRRFAAGKAGDAVCALVVDEHRLYTVTGPEVPPPTKKLLKPEAIASGSALIAWSLADGREAWRLAGKALDPRSLALGPGRTVVHDHGSALIALDADRGREAWRVPESEFPQAKGLYTFLRPVRTGERTPYVLISHGMVLLTAPGVDRILGIDLASGKVAYKLDRPGGDGALRALLVDRGNLLLAGVKGASWLDVLTGKTADKQLPPALFDGCARPTISPGLSMARSGIVCDRGEADAKVTDGASRSGCEPGGGGVIAGGLSIVTPQGYCTCPTILPGGFLVRRAAARDRFRAETAGSAIEMGPAGPATRSPPNPADWVQGRHDASGSNASPAKLSGMKPAWKAAGAGAERTTAPIAAGGLVYLADDRGLLRALAEDDGAERWRVLLGGAVLQPPTIAEGRLLVGSGDGLLTCLDPATGALAWRLRVPAADRRQMLYGAWSSTWPVHSGVAVHDGTAYAAGGMVPDDGIWAVAIGVADGKLRWRKHLEIPNATVVGDLRWHGKHLWLAAGQRVGALRIDPATGAAEPFLSADTWKRTLSTAPFGSDVLGFAADVLVIGGRHLHALPNNEADHRKSERGSAPHHQVFSVDGADAVATPAKGRDQGREFGHGNDFLAPAWDEQLTVWCDSPFRNLAAGATPALRSALAKNPSAFDSNGIVRLWGDASEKTKHKNADSSADLLAVALTADAVICLRDVAGPWMKSDPNTIPVIDGKAQLPPAADAWELVRFDRASGKEAGVQALPGRPRLDGLCITAKGAVVVTLADGGIVLHR